MPKGAGRWRYHRRADQERAMRKRLLGTIAAVAAGTGGAFGQEPLPPAALGPVGMPAPPAHAHGTYADPIPNMIGRPQDLSGATGAFAGYPGMDGGMAGLGGDGGFPGYPAGLHGDMHWQSPSLRGVQYDRALAPKVWVNANYLLWFAKSQPTNFPFVTTSAPNEGGQLGQPTTTILHSRTDLGYDLFSGFKIDGGMFLDAARRTGFYASGFMTEQKANTFYAASDATGQPLLARPFFNLGTGAPDVQLVSFPTYASGSVVVYSRSQSYGAEGGPMCNIYRSSPDCGGSGCTVNLLTGFRYFELNENLEMASRSTLLNGSTATFDGKQYTAPATIEVRDQFTTINQFYGGNVGLMTENRWGRWSTNVTGKLAMGVMHQRINIDGRSALADPLRGIASTVVGGLFANSTNIGRYTNDEFCVIPEVTAALAYHWTSWFSTSVGYNFIYVSRVARPGDQYNPGVNPAVVPTSPSFGFGSPLPGINPIADQSDFWLQGINFACNVRF
jgi:hypothetical protein